MLSCGPPSVKLVIGRDNSYMCYWTSYTLFGITMGAMVAMVDFTIAVIPCDVQSDDSGYMTMTMLTLVDIS